MKYDRTALKMRQSKRTAAVERPELREDSSSVQRRSAASPTSASVKVLDDVTVDAIARYRKAQKFDCPVCVADGSGPNG